MNFSNTRWLFFDIDDTLWDFATNSLDSLTYLYKSSTLLKQYFKSLDCFLNSYHALNSQLWNQYAAGMVEAEFLKVERFRGILWPGLTPHSTSDDKLAICDLLNNSYLSYLAERKTLNPGAIETLQRLQAHFMIGALTNGFSNVQYKKIYNTGLWKYIARMVISDETPWRKPDKRLFDFAAAAVGASPQECVMIGDNPETDIAGARNAGWQAICYSKSGEGDINRLSQLPDLLIGQ